MSKSLDADAVSVLDRSSRRRFLRNGAGFALVGVALAASSRGVQAADCDQGGERSASSDQDAGESADYKECEEKNIISEHQPERKHAIKVAKVKV